MALEGALIGAARVANEDFAILDGADDMDAAEAAAHGIVVRGAGPEPGEEIGFLAGAAELELRAGDEANAADEAAGVSGGIEDEPGARLDGAEELTRDGAAAIADGIHALDGGLADLVVELERDGGEVLWESVVEEIVKGGDGAGGDEAGELEGLGAGCLCTAGDLDIADIDEDALVAGDDIDGELGGAAKIVEGIALGEAGKAAEDEVAALEGLDLEEIAADGAGRELAVSFAGTGDEAV